MANTFHEEQDLGKVYDHRLVRRLWTFISPYKKLVAACILLIPLVTAAQLAPPYIMGRAVDIFINQKITSTFKILVYMFLTALIAEYFLRFTQIFVTQLVGQKVIYDLRMAVFSHLQRLATRFFDKNPVGRLVTRATSDIEVITEVLNAGLTTLPLDFAVLFGIVAVLLYTNWKLALITFAVLPLLIAAVVFFRKRMRAAFRRIRVRLARINASLQEYITGMSVVQLFTHEEETYREFGKLNKDHADATIENIYYEASLTSFMEMMGSFTVALIIWYGGAKILGGPPGLAGSVDGITFGTLVTFIEYMRRFFAPINDISAHYGTLQSAMASSERIFDLLDTDEIIPAQETPKKAEEFKGAISFDNVSFAYNEDNYILKDVSFTVAPGEKVALVGATGAGKTSIIKLLNRLYDVNKGGIKIDGIDIRDWELKELRQTVGVVLQDVFLFTGTMASNIRLGDDRIPDNIVKWAATQVNAHEFISRLPAGYFEEVKERGHNLSVGQRQLLSFARALAYDPKILVLDEATSSVDTETEMLIEEALLRLMKGRTSIVIAHRLSTIKHVDRIIVLHKGEVRESGTHAELMSRKGIYHRLYQLQYRQQEKAAN